MPRILPLLALAAFCSAAFPASALETRAVGAWAIKSGQAKDGPYCTMQRTVDGKSVGVQVTADGKQYLSVTNPSWLFTPRTFVPAKVEIDGKPTFDDQAFVALETVLVMPLPKTTDAVAEMAGGKTLVATVGTGPVTYDLAGAGPARDALKTCLAARKSQ